MRDPCGQDGRAHAVSRTLDLGMPAAAGVFTGGQRGLVTPNMTAKGVRA